MDEGISKVIKQLKDKQNELMNKVQKIQSTIDSLRDVFGEQMVIPETLPEVSLDRVPAILPYSGMKIGEAAILFLEKTATPQKTRAIADALDAGGIQSSDTYRAIYNALDNREGVFLDEQKRWNLRKWAKG